ncbi:EF-hand and coiled-coil domain-containing protein 1 [Gastrophryne carolinensis]
MELTDDPYHPLRPARRTQWLVSVLAHHYGLDRGLENELLVMATGLDQYLQEVFHHLDWRGESYISGDEFRALCQVLGLKPGTEEECEGLLDRLPERLTFRQFHARLCGYFSSKGGAPHLPVRRDSDTIQTQFCLRRRDTPRRSRETSEDGELQRLEDQNQRLSELVEDMRAALQSSDARCLALQVGLYRNALLQKGEDFSMASNIQLSPASSPITERCVLRGSSIIQSSKDEQMEEMLKINKDLEEELRKTQKHLIYLEECNHQLMKAHTEIRMRAECVRQVLLACFRKVKCLEEKSSKSLVVQRHMGQLEAELQQYMRCVSGILGVMASNYEGLGTVHWVLIGEEQLDDDSGCVDGAGLGSGNSMSEHLQEIKVLFTNELDEYYTESAKLSRFNNEISLKLDHTVLSASGFGSILTDAIKDSREKAPPFRIALSAAVNLGARIALNIRGQAVLDRTPQLAERLCDPSACVLVVAKKEDTGPYDSWRPIVGELCMRVIGNWDTSTFTVIRSEEVAVCLAAQKEEILTMRPCYTIDNSGIKSPTEDYVHRGDNQLFRSVEGRAASDEEEELWIKEPTAEEQGITSYGSWCARGCDVRRLQKLLSNIGSNCIDYSNIPFLLAEGVSRLTEELTNKEKEMKDLEMLMEEMKVPFIEELDRKDEELEVLRIDLQMLETERVRLSLFEEKLLDVLELLQQLRDLGISNQELGRVLLNTLEMCREPQHGKEHLFEVLDTLRHQLSVCDLLRHQQENKDNKAPSLANSLVISC